MLHQLLTTCLALCLPPAYGYHKGDASSFFSRSLFSFLALSYFPVWSRPCHASKSRLAFSSYPFNFFLQVPVLCFVLFELFPCLPLSCSRTIFNNINRLIHQIISHTRSHMDRAEPGWVGPGRESFKLIHRQILYFWLRLSSWAGELWRFTHPFIRFSLASLPKTAVVERVAWLFQKIAIILNNKTVNHPNT